MRKTGKRLLLSLFSLFLVGCHPIKGSVSSTIERTDPREETSEEISSHVITSSDDLPFSSSEEKDSTSSSFDIYKTTAWRKNVADEMRKYLGGNILPFIGLRKPEADYINTPSKNTSYLQITGLNEFSERVLKGYKEVFLDEDWKLVGETKTRVTLIKDDLKVIIGKTKDSSFVLQAYYDEPFDRGNTIPIWDDLILTAYAEYLSHTDIPYIYLGSKNPYFHYSSLDDTLSIYGWNYDESILTDARETLEKEGWKVKDEKDNLIASKTYPDSDTLTLSIASLSEKSLERTCMKIRLSEEFNPRTVSIWTNSVMRKINSLTQGHPIPFIYLGTKYAKATYDERNNTLVFTGNTWNREILSLAKDSFLSHGWNVRESSNRYGPVLIATIDFDDGSSLEARIETPEDEHSKATMKVKITKGLFIPSYATDWDSQTKAMMEEYFYGYTLPYIYLGDIHTQAIRSNEYCRITIRPQKENTFDKKMIEHARRVLLRNGYIITSGKNRYGKTLKAEKTLDNKDSIVVTFDSVPSSMKPTLNIYYFEKFDASLSTTLDWHDNDDHDFVEDVSTGAEMEKYFFHHEIPFIYLGARNFISTYDKEKQRMTVYGNTYRDVIISLAETNLRKANETKEEGDTDWLIQDDRKKATTTTKEVPARTMTAIKTFKDGCTITLRITRPLHKNIDILNEAAVLTIDYQSK